MAKSGFPPPLPPNEAAVHQGIYQLGDRLSQLGQANADKSAFSIMLTH